jgi:hypothetical protein
MVFSLQESFMNIPTELVRLGGKSVFGAQLKTDGITSFTLPVTLARNAMVQSYPVVIHANPASAATVNTVAQIRATKSPSLSGGTSIVVDFGTPRTISALSVPTGLGIVRVTPWMGTAFGPGPIFESSAGVIVAAFPAEVRTERLLVEANGTVSNVPELASQMGVLLPEAPSDLEVRIDGGAPVVSLPGPAQPGPDPALSTTAWNKDGERLVDLAPGLASLVGDPTKSGDVTFKAVLTSRVPGVLSMVAQTPDVSYVRRVVFAGETSKEVVFNSEGTQDVPLESLPASLSIRRINLNAAATLPPERTIPPDGPNDAGLAELLIDPQQAVCVRFRSGTALGEITAVRLPLSAANGGAEMRIILWANKEAAVEPLEPIDGAVSDPVEVSANDETWITFPFKKPVAITASNPPWAVLSVTRGGVTYRLGANSGPSDPFEKCVIRRGAPTGPFKLLPRLFQSGATFGASRGRIRMVGHAAKGAVVAPLIASVAPSTSSVEISPTPKGTATTLSFSTPLAVTAPVLRLTSRVGGSVTLRDVDVVSTT